MIDQRIITFLCVCECMNYTKASQELHITQPAVSQHIRFLEERYNTKLFTYQDRKLALTKAGFQGASVVDSEGMLKSLNQDSVDAPTIFGGLRQFVNPGRQQNKMILVVLKDEEIQNAIDIIHSVSGDMKLPNTGILFTLPVTRWEVSKN